MIKNFKLFWKIQIFQEANYQIENFAAVGKSKKKIHHYIQQNVDKIAINSRNPLNKIEEIRKIPHIVYTKNW